MQSGGPPEITVSSPDPASPPQLQIPTTDTSIITPTSPCRPPECEVEKTRSQIGKCVLHIHRINDDRQERIITVRDAARLRDELRPTTIVRCLRCRCKQMGCCGRNENSKNGNIDNMAKEISENYCLVFAFLIACRHGDSIWRFWHSKKDDTAITLKKIQKTDFKTLFDQDPEAMDPDDVNYILNRQYPFFMRSISERLHDIGDSHEIVPVDIKGILGGGNDGMVYWGTFLPGYVHKELDCFDMIRDKELAIKVLNETKPDVENCFRYPHHSSINPTLLLLRQHDPDRSILVSPRLASSLADLLHSSPPDAYTRDRLRIWKEIADLLEGMAALHRRHPQDSNRQMSHSLPVNSNHLGAPSQRLTSWIHRDVKPENILVRAECEGGGLCLTDLDNALEVTTTNAQDLSRLSRPDAGRVCAAPEGSKGGALKEQIVCRSDVFSLGVVGLLLFKWRDGGPEALKRFHEMRKKELGKWGNDTSVSQFYYTDSSNQNERHLLTAVTDVFDEMCRSPEDRPFVDILTKMMSVDHEARSTAEKAESSFRQIFKSGNTDTPSIIGNRIPESPRVSLPLINGLTVPHKRSCRRSSNPESQVDDRDLHNSPKRHKT